MAEQWRILVVEIEEKLNWNIVNTLQKDGYVMRGVASGAEAIRLLWSEAYDVVICCQPLPDTDGFELLQWMRTYCPNAQMIMLAQAGGGVMRSSALEMGVASYLEKPLDIRVLKEELRRLLHQTGFSANLDSFDLLDVIQIITMSRKSIALVVSTGLEEQGVLRFQNGELIWAEYGTLRGEEAFFALAAHKNGTVIHRHWNEQITPNVTLPLSRLIFQALQYRSKYASYQQLSSELDAVRPTNGGNSGFPAMPQMPSTAMPAVLQDFPNLPSTAMPAALQDLEDDDQPFLFVAEDLPAQQPSSHMAFDPFSQRNGLEMDRRTVSPAEPGVRARQGSNNSVSGGSGSGTNGYAITGGSSSRPLPADDDVESIMPSAANNAPTRLNGMLPSWLTDQPTDRELPVLRGNAGFMPTATKDIAVPQPVSPPTPVPPSIAQSSPTDPTLPSVSPTAISSNGSTEWSSPSLPGTFNPAASGLRKIQPEEAFYTGPQRVIRSGTSAVRNSGAMLRPSPAERQGPESRIGLTGNGSREESPEKTVEALQSLNVLKKTGTLPSVAVPFQTENRPNALPTRTVEETASPRNQSSVTKHSQPERASTSHQTGITLPPRFDESGSRNQISTASPQIEEIVPRNQSAMLPKAPFKEKNSYNHTEVEPSSQLEELRPHNTIDLIDILPFEDLSSYSSIEVASVKSPTEREIQKPSDPVTPNENEAVTRTGQPEKPVRRNYPALAAALQTLGYSVPGFIASAVISLDGTPIAQVAVDDLDISLKCLPLSNIVQSALQALSGEYEHSIITGKTQHILLRQISDQEDVFQILITARETNPDESLEVMVNVEAAIASALH